MTCLPLDREEFTVISLSHPLWLSENGYYHSLSLSIQLWWSHALHEQNRGKPSPLANLLLEISDFNFWPNRAQRPVVQPSCRLA